jgi:hypothetical protein
MERFVMFIIQSHDILKLKIKKIPPTKAVKQPVLTRKQIVDEGLAMLNQLITAK